MTIDKPLKSMIIGCGSIGALKPDQFDRPYGSNILTHAHAYRVSPDIHLCGVVDIDEQKAIKAAKKWEVFYETDMISALEDWEPDIISVCVPTEYHFNVLVELADQKHKPKLIIVEKPFCENLERAKKISKIYKALKIPILINYNRRFSVEHLFIKQRIQKGELGKIYHARLMYGRGLLRDGCHGLDLFNWFLGKITGVIVNTLMYDYLPQDPTVSMFLSYEFCNDVHFVGIDSRKYRIFELELITEKEIIRLTENGLWARSYLPIDEPIYGAYKAMPGSPSEGRKTDLTNTLSRMVANAAEHILYKKPLICTNDDAIAVHATIDAVNRINELTEKEKKRRCLH